MNLVFLAFAATNAVVLASNANKGEEPESRGMMRGFAPKPALDIPDQPVRPLPRDARNGASSYVETKSSSLAHSSSRSSRKGSRSLAFKDCTANQHQDKNELEKFAPIAVSNFPIKPSGRRKFIWVENNKAPDNSWTFLTKFDFRRSWFPWRSNYYYVETMDADTALTYIKRLLEQRKKKRVLFWIHGWNSSLDPNFCTVYKLAKNVDDALIVPLLWNNDRGETSYIDYRYDRVWTAPRAGATLAELYGNFFSKLDVPKSWICHSMGCFVTQFFAGDVNDKNGFYGEKHEDLYMVAPDVRYDLFNEYPPGAGKDKNECYVGPPHEQWNDPDMSWRIPDCRPGGGEAIANMVKGKVKVYWHENDWVGGWRESRLKADLLHTWPISFKPLFTNGNNTEIGGREPNATLFDTKVSFVNVESLLGDDQTEHNYQVFEKIMKTYQPSA